MAEQSLSDIVIHLISWIESLHEKNLKYEAQVETLSRDLAEAQNSKEQLEARLSAYQLDNSHQLQSPVSTSTTTFHQQQVESEQRQTVGTSDQHQLMSTQQDQQQLVHPQLTSAPTTSANLHQVPGQPQQLIYQPIPVASGPSFVPHPQYLWTTYDTTSPMNGNGGYYDQYGGAPAPTVITAPPAFVQQQP